MREKDPEIEPKGLEGVGNHNKMPEISGISEDAVKALIGEADIVIKLNALETLGNHNGNT